MFANDGVDKQMAKMENMNFFISRLGPFCPILSNFEFSGKGKLVVSVSVSVSVSGACSISFSLTTSHLH